MSASYQKMAFTQIQELKFHFPKATNNIKSKLIALGLKKQIDEFEYKMNALRKKLLMMR